MKQLDEAMEDLRQRRGQLVEQLMGLKMRLLVCLVCVLWAGVVSAQTPAKVFVWEHVEAELSANIVTRFELSVDGGAFVSVGLTPSADLPQAGFRAFQAAVPSLTPGKHTAAVRACNTALCSDPTVALEFTLDVKPSVPVRLRFPVNPQD